MTGEELARMWRRARGYGMKFGPRDYAEDFASWLVLKRLEGHALKQTITQSYWDFLRQEHGAMDPWRRGIKDAALPAYRGYKKVDPFYDPNERRLNTEPPWDLNVIEQKVWDAMVSLMESGTPFLQFELAESMGITQSYMSIIMKSIKGKLKNRESDVTL